MQVTGFYSRLIRLFCLCGIVFLWERAAAKSLFLTDDEQVMGQKKTQKKKGNPLKINAVQASPAHLWV